MYDINNEKEGTPQGNLYGWHELLANGHCYCPEHCCEWPMEYDDAGQIYCSGCSQHIGQENSLTILAKQENGATSRIVLR